MHKQDPRILPSVYKQDPRILPSVPKQDSPSANSFSTEDCPNNWAKLDDHCYHVTKLAKSWDEAQDYCKEQQANLVSIKSAVENNFVLDLVQEIDRPNAWTGMKAALHWYDSPDVDYTNWASGEPDGQATKPCVLMHTGEDPKAGFWNAYPCKVDLEVVTVCKKPLSVES